MTRKKLTNKPFKRRGAGKIPPSVFKSKLLVKQKALLASKLTMALSSVQTRGSLNYFTPELVTRLVQEMNSTKCLYCPATGCIKDVHKTYVCHAQDVVEAHNLYCETAEQKRSRELQH